MAMFSTLKKNQLVLFFPSGVGFCAYFFCVFGITGVNYFGFWWTGMFLFFWQSACAGDRIRCCVDDCCGLGSSSGRMFSWLCLRLSWSLRLSFESMGWKRSTFEDKRVKIYGQVLLGFLLICALQFSSADTDPTDGKASFSLFAFHIFHILW